MSARRMRPGVVLIAVLVTVSVGAMVGLTAMYFADAQRRGGTASLRQAQSRSAAWSGVQAVMASLAAQRDDLLRGGEPDLSRLSTVWLGGDERGEAWGFRVVPVGGVPAAAEAARVNLNSADESMLGGLPGWTPERAAAVVSERGAMPLASVHELAWMKDGVRVAPESSAGPPAEEVGSDNPSDELELVTVFSMDPGVRAGVGRGGRGDQKVSLLDGWTPGVERAISEELSDGAVASIRTAVQGGARPRNDRQIVRMLRDVAVPTKDWAAALDLLGGEDRAGARIDLLRADARVLALLPGIDASLAARIADVRRGLDRSAAGSVAWLVTEEVLTPEQFEQVVDRLTHRSMQWRVVVEGGARGDGAAVSGAGDAGSGDPGAGRLGDRVVFEAVIDVSGVVPRVIYLREVTAMEFNAYFESEFGVRGRPSAAPVEDTEPDRNSQDSVLAVARNPGVSAEQSTQRAEPAETRDGAVPWGRVARWSTERGGQR